MPNTKFDCGAFNLPPWAVIENEPPVWDAAAHYVANPLDPLPVGPPDTGYEWLLIEADYYDVADGDGVNNWASTRGDANVFVNFSNIPTYKANAFGENPAITFNGARMRADFVNPLPSSGTTVVIAVLRDNGVFDATGFYTFTEQPGFVFGHNTSALFTKTGSPYPIPGTSPTLLRDTAHLVKIVNDNVLHVDGIEYDPTPFGMGSDATYMTLGAATTGYTRAIVDFGTYLILRFPGTIDGTAVAAWETYLANKYGIVLP